MEEIVVNTGRRSGKTKAMKKIKEKVEKQPDITIDEIKQLTDEEFFESVKNADSVTRDYTDIEIIEVIEEKTED